jgi:hypothetical protein
VRSPWAGPGKSWTVAAGSRARKRRRASTTFWAPRSASSALTTRLRLVTSNEVVVRQDEVADLRYARSVIAWEPVPPAPTTAKRRPRWVDYPSFAENGDLAAEALLLSGDHSAVQPQEAVPHDRDRTLARACRPRLRPIHGRIVSGCSGRAQDRDVRAPPGSRLLDPGVGRVWAHAEPS